MHIDYYMRTLEYPPKGPINQRWARSIGAYEVLQVLVVKVHYDDLHKYRGLNCPFWDKCQSNFAHIRNQPVEKGPAELTKERMSFPDQKKHEEGESSENDEREERPRDNETINP